MTITRVFRIGPPEQPLAEFTKGPDGKLTAVYQSKGFENEVLVDGLVWDFTDGATLTPDDGDRFIEVLKRMFRSSITTKVVTMTE